MKTKLFTLLFALLSASGVFAWDYDRVPIGDLYYNLDATTRIAAVTSEIYYVFLGGDNYASLSGAVVIPSSVTYNNIQYSVTSIGDQAFYGCTGLTSITIPESVTSIGIDAFYRCTGLTSINIPDKVTRIGNGAFDWCTSLTSITIPESVTSLEDRVFSGCTGLTSINIPDKVTRIGNWAFDWCTSLTSINIPESVTSIGEGVFRGCTGLTSITIAAGNTVYDSRNNCNAIIETATNTLIQGCNGTIIPESVTSIGDDAFYGCTGLTSITIPEGVASIGSSAFEGCTGLTAITWNVRNYSDDYAFNQIAPQIVSFGLMVKNGDERGIYVL